MAKENSSKKTVQFTKEIGNKTKSMVMVLIKSQNLKFIKEHSSRANNQDLVHKYLKMVTITKVNIKIINFKEKVILS